MGKHFDREPVDNRQMGRLCVVVSYGISTIMPEVFQYALWGDLRKAVHTEVFPPVRDASGIGSCEYAMISSTPRLYISHVLYTYSYSYNLAALSGAYNFSVLALICCAYASEEQIFLDQNRARIRSLPSPSAFAAQARTQQTSSSPPSSHLTQPSTVSFTFAILPLYVSYLSFSPPVSCLSRRL